METKPYQRVWLEEAAPGETFIYKEGKAEREDVQNADIILGNVSPKLISTGDKLKWLQTNSAGVDGYIHGYLPKETVLTNATGAYGLAISEYMVAVWLELLKKLHLYRDVQRTGKWCDLGQVRSAWNSTVLVLGLGDIGGEFAKRAKALGARVIGVRRTGTDKPDFVDELIHTDKLDEYLPQADCVAIGDSTNDLPMLECAALENGKLAGAGVDVTDPEPLPADHPLWKMENAVITPHISGGYHLQETHDRIVRIMAENLKRFLAGEPLRNVVDFSTGYRKL